MKSDLNKICKQLGFSLEYDKEEDDTYIAKLVLYSDSFFTLYEAEDDLELRIIKILKEVINANQR